MWADNETDLDFLGFDFLVDGLVVALTEPRLLPLTVGVLGDWGSGKSSLMRIAAGELPPWKPDPAGDDPDGYLVVSFSPWQYEDHEDVKIALMSAILDAIASRVPAVETQVSVVRAALNVLRRLARRGMRVGANIAPTVVPIVLQATVPDADAGTAQVVAAATKALASEVESSLSDPAPSSRGDGSTTGTDPRGDVDTFRREFAKLIELVPRCGALVVLIDDLDRCLPDTVVDTFEAIRLFLNTPKTAYVLAMNQSVVESAVDSRYPELRKHDGAGIGRDYLEKMLQLKVAIPPLSEPEAETYVNLLFAELHLTEGDFADVLAATQDARRDNGLAVAFSLGCAGATLGEALPKKLIDDMEWAAEIAPVLGSSLRGNPRQLKRFLNNLLLKHRSALRREVTLELPVLAKLMVLEDQYKTDFQMLFDWELAAGGRCDEVKLAESHARGTMAIPVEAPKPDVEPASAARPAESATVESAASGETSSAVVWAQKKYVAEWLRIEPTLIGVDLRPYFTYSRDKLSFGVSGSRLSPALQQLLNDVQSDVEAVRRTQIRKIEALQSSERGQLVEALLDRARRNPSAPTLLAMVEIAGSNEDMVVNICSVLIEIPTRSIPITVGTRAVRDLPPEHPSVLALLDAWADSESQSLRNVVQTARNAQAKGARRGNVR